MMPPTTVSTARAGEAPVSATSNEVRRPIRSMRSAIRKVPSRPVALLIREKVSAAVRSTPKASVQSEGSQVAMPWLT